MSIHKIGSDLIRPYGPKQSSGTSASEKSGLSVFSKAERSDRVEISSEGRNLAAQVTEESEGASGPNLAAVRQRIDRGFYNDPGVIEEVAHRLVASGDLDPAG